MKPSLLFVGLLGSTKQAQSPIKDDAWPLYSDLPPAKTLYADSKILAYNSAGTLYYGGYQCIRYGNVYTPSQDVSGTSPNHAVVTNSATVRTFYTEKLDATNLGALPLNFDCCPLDISTTTVCPGLTDNTDATSNSKIIPSKVWIYKGELPLILPFTLDKTYDWNTDFLLASQAQHSAPLSASRSGEWCDKQYIADTASTFSTIAGFSGKFKCTYIY